MQNAQNFNTMASDKRWVNLMGGVKEARQELKTLAPHPNKPDHKGPLFVRDNAKAANDDGAVFAHMLIGMALSHFGVAAGLPQWTQYADTLNVIDVYDAYRHEQNHAPKDDGEGTRGYTLGNKGAITGGFNMNTTHRAVNTDKEAMAWEAYMQDLPRRNVVEQSLASMNREADLREKLMLRQNKQMERRQFAMNL